MKLNENLTLRWILKGSTECKDRCTIMEIGPYQRWQILFFDREFLFTVISIHLVVAAELAAARSTVAAGASAFSFHS